MKLIGSVTLTAAIGILQLESYTTLAFVPSSCSSSTTWKKTSAVPSSTKTTSLHGVALRGSGRMSEDIGIPCEEECALDSFPNMPLSVNPGVVTGQALVDLLNHAKENGKVTVESCCRFYYIIPWSV